MSQLTENEKNILQYYKQNDIDNFNKYLYLFFADNSKEEVINLKDNLIEFLFHSIINEKLLRSLFLDSKKQFKISRNILNKMASLFPISLLNEIIYYKIISFIDFTDDEKAIIKNRTELLHLNHVFDNDLIIIKKLHTTNISTVLLVKSKSSSTTFIVKILLYNDHNLYEYVTSSKLDQCTEYNVICCLGMRKTNAYIFISYEYIENSMDLFYFVKENRGKDFNHLKHIALEIAKGIKYIHNKNIIHLDIKLDNVLIYGNDYNKIKIIDFGLSCINDTEDDHVRKCSEIDAPCGTDTYIDPLFMANPKSVNYKNDIYSLGVLYKFLFGKFINDEIKILISRMKNVEDINSRPSIDEIISLLQ